MRRAVWVAGIALALGILAVAAAFVLLQVQQRQAIRLEDRTSAPLILAPSSEIAADLDYPPGGIAVTAAGRVFITFHPSGGPPLQLAEMRGVTPEPFPSLEFQDKLSSALALRIDAKNRLWVLDYGSFGLWPARLFVIHLDVKDLIEEYDLSDSAGLLSMLGDFQVDPSATLVYMADGSPVLGNPAIVVYDTMKKTGRRLLESHPALQGRDYVIQAPGRELYIPSGAPIAVSHLHLALDPSGEWLYIARLTGDRLYRVRTADLNDVSLTAATLSERVEDFSAKPLGGGMAVDTAGNIYMSDPEHSAVVRVTADGALETAFKDSPLRWPHGLSFGPDGWLWVACSSLHEIVLTTPGAVERGRPYYIIRFKAGAGKQ